MKRNNQKGFTIIELVVVILLLGILTATALPRFMDVTNEAHTAVVDGLQGGLQTGAALFRATWVAKGQPATAVVGFGADNLIANTAGYPVGTDDATLENDAVDCLAVYNGLMQQGGLPVAAGVAASGNTAGAIETDVEATASSTVDVVARPNNTTPTACEFYYVGQFKAGDSTTNRIIPRLTYTPGTGVIIKDTFTLQVDP